MMWLPSPLERAGDQFREDLAADPYLKYILLLSALLSMFWIWHRLPNFATRDERWRVVDAMEVAGFVESDGLTLDALSEGAKYWRVFGPTLYLYGLVALPAIGLTFAIGEAAVFADLLGAWSVDLYAHWQTLPAWLWWATVLPARLVNALLAVGCVYLLYRIGTHLRDRATGRLAALLLALTWGVIMLAHEAGEDVPALFCILLVFYLAVRYVETGSGWLFLGASAVGGLAIAFKPTAGITAAFLGIAYLFRAGWTEDPVRALARPAALVGTPAVALGAVYLVSPDVVGGLLNAFESVAETTAWIAGAGVVVAYLYRERVTGERVRALARPALLVGGPIVALLAMYFAFPSAVLNGPEVLIDRVDRVANEKTRSHGWLDRPAWWWYVRGAINGLGWPLAITSVIGIGAAVVTLGGRLLRTVVSDRGLSLRRDSATPRVSIETVGIVLALMGIAVMTAVFSTWAYFRTHHLLPMFPLAILLVALALRWLADSSAAVGPVDSQRLFQGATAVLLLTTAIYASVGTVGYATQPRDRTVSWLLDHGGDNATVETYAYDSQEAAVPHGWTIYRPTTRADDTSRREWLQNVEQRCPEYIVLNYQRSMLWLAPDNHSQLSERWTGFGDAEYVRDLLSEDGSYETMNAPYPYEVAARFGPEPPFLDDGDPFDRTWNMIRAGIFPRTIQYGDPQDFGVYGYAVVLEREGSCDGSN